MGAEVPVRRVESIEFGILSPEDIIGISVCKIEHPETMESGVPKEGGLIDLRMGTSERGFLCSTCSHRSSDCPGHFGYIELAKPVYHIGFLGRIKKVLESVCFFCSKLRIDKNLLKSPVPKTEKERKRRLNHIWALAKNKSVCLGESLPHPDPSSPDEKIRSGCENKQPTIRKEGLHLLAYQKGEENSSAEGKVVLSAEKVLEILRRISDEDILALGFDLQRSRPEWMLIQVLPVPPPQARPSIVMEGSLRCEDDLTHKFADIIKASTNLRRYEQEGAPGHIVRDYEQLLQFHVATLINNDISGQPQSLQKNGRPLKSLRARLRGKEGRVRGNLMGKRVDFSARTVITADPNISMNEVGVPEEIAKMLTFPERVTDYNLAETRKLAHAGPHSHPGANYVVRDDGQRIDLRFHRGELSVQPGYVVERHLRDGDIVLFNRQPSLHKMSMMAHRARVMKYSTFKLNLSVTSPYNADFDGDEMNLHLPQSLPAQTELLELALVEKNIVSPQSNRPVMGVVQDTLLGVYKLTRRDVFLGRGLFYNLVYAVDNGRPVSEPVILRPVQLYAGKQVFSHVLPPVTYEGLHSAHRHDVVMSPNAADTVVRIHEGELLCGTVCKKTVGTSSGGLVHVVASDFPRSVCVQFIDALQRAVTTWLAFSESFSVGIGDTVADPPSQDKIRSAIEKAREEVGRLVERAESGKLERAPGMSLRESFEAAVTLALNRARDASGSWAQAPRAVMNNIKKMVLAGSKGSFINVSQMSACVGQQSVEGRRLVGGFRSRALPHFPKDDCGPSSRGFVASSYILGLSPSEFFFHAMGGREGLIDTAVKTAETGYIQRRLVKALEDAQVRHDKSVRDGEGNMLQCAYGGDCVDATYIEMQSLALHCAPEEFENRFVLTASHLPEQIVTPRILSALRRPASRQVILEEVEELRRERDWVIRTYSKDKKPLPVPLSRIFRDARRLSERAARSPVPLANSPRTSPASAGLGDVLPERVVGARRRLEAELRSAISPVGEVAESAFRLFRAHLRGYASIKRVLCEFRLSPHAFDWALERARQSFLRAVVSPGEMVGTLAAQSVGEPATQMTLNTFHLAGVASTVSRGVPRLKEIINAARTVKTPSLLVYLKENSGYPKEGPGSYLKEESGGLSGAKKAQQELERCYILDVLEKSEVIYDPALTAVPEDADLIDTYTILEPDLRSPASPWTLRLTLSRSALVERGLGISQVAAKIESAFAYKCMHSDENAFVQVVRCLLPDEEEKLRRLEQAVVSLRLKGFPGISRAFIAECPQTSEFFLQTEGTGLADVLAHPLVDAARTVSNDPLEVCEVLGVEAGRAAILNEIRAVIEADGSYVNFRHLSMLADVMTQRGMLSGITRHGTNRGSKGALMRCSFEETVEILLEAAACAETDPCKGVVESVMLGQLAAIGTGITDVAVDKESLEIGAMAMQKYDFEDDEDSGKTPPSMSTSYLDGSSKYSVSSPSTPGSPGSNPSLWSPGGGSGYAYSPGTSFMGSAYSPASPGAQGGFSPGYFYSPKEGAATYSPTTSRMAYTPSATYTPAYKPAPNTPRMAAYSPNRQIFGGIMSPSSPTMYTTTQAPKKKDPGSEEGSSSDEDTLDGEDYFK